VDQEVWVEVVVDEGAMPSSISIGGKWIHTRLSLTTHYSMSVSSTDLLTWLDPVRDAAYNTGPRADSKCFQGTRLDIIKELSLWADRPLDRRIAWLHGPAGFGKSAVARTLAESVASEQPTNRELLLLPKFRRPKQGRSVAPHPCISAHYLYA
jgi:hypothetical protein